MDIFTETIKIQAKILQRTMHRPKVLILLNRLGTFGPNSSYTLGGFVLVNCWKEKNVLKLGKRKTFLSLLNISIKNSFSTLPPLDYEKVNCERRQKSHVFQFYVLWWPASKKVLCSYLPVLCSHRQNCPELISILQCTVHSSNELGKTTFCHQFTMR